MPLRLEPPVIREFELTEVDKKYEVSGTRVSIRQASQFEAERRAEIWASIVSRMSPDGRTMEIVSKFSQPELQRIEAYLTMADCNIQDEDGKPLFTFSGTGYSRRTSLSEQDFFKAWGKLPTFVAEQIHECVVAVNVGWGRLGEEPSTSS